MASSKRDLPENADQAILKFKDGSEISLQRDESSYSAWTFTIFDPDAGPDPIGRGNLSAKAVALWVNQADSVTAPGEDGEQEEVNPKGLIPDEALHGLSQSHPDPTKRPGQPLGPDKVPSKAPSSGGSSKSSSGASSKKSSSSGSSSKKSSPKAKSEETAAKSEQSNDKS